MEDVEFDEFHGKVRPDAERDFLTRLDETGGGLRLLILSAEIPVRPDWCRSHAWETKAVQESFLDHASFRFSLLANPTRKIAAPRDADGKRRGGKRVPVSRREDLLEWLERKGEQHGFTIAAEAIRTIPRPQQPFIKAGKAGLHTAIEFTGVLSVTDAGSGPKSSTSSARSSWRSSAGQGSPPSSIFPTFRWLRHTCRDDRRPTSASGRAAC